jgi:chromate transporter
MKEYLELLKSFVLIGALTFGGGYSMMPMLTREIVDKHHWATQEELLDYFAIGQCVPGIIAVNTATFIGYRRRGFLGAVIAMIGVVLPSLIIIILIAIFLSRFMDNELVAHAFEGIRVAVSALIATAVVNLFRQSTKTWLKACIAAIAFASVALFGFSPIYVTVAFAVFGVLFYGRRRQA